MLEFNEDGDLYLDLATQGFLPELFHRWRVLGTNHVVSIVLCARVLYDSTDITHHGELLSRDPAVHRHFPGDASDTTSTWYKDFYKVVVDWETRTDWASVLPAVKEEVQVFYRRIMQLSPASIPTAMNGEPALDPTDEFIRLLRHSPMECVQVGRLAAAWEGNVLEAMNLVSL